MCRVDHRPGLGHKLFERFKLAINTGKADVRDLVHFSQFLGDQLPDFVAGNFFVEGFEDFFFDFFDDSLEGVGLYRAACSRRVPAR